LLTSHAIQAGLVVLLGAIVLTPLIRRIIHRRFDPFEPIVLFALAFGVMFVVRPAAMLVRDDLSYETSLTVLDVSATFTEMLLIALLAAGAFVLGYSLPATARRRRNDHVDPTTLGLAAASVACVAILAFAGVLAAANGPETLLLFLKGRSPELAQATENASLYPWAASLMLVPATIAIVFTALQTRKLLFVLASVFLSSLVLLRTVPGGDRIALLPFLGALFVLFYLRRSARPSNLTLIAVAAGALIGSTFLSDLRGRSSRGESVRDTVVNIASDPSRLARPLTTGPDSEMAPTFAAALAVIPEELPHRYGRVVFGDLVARPIPRPLWPGKPSPPRDDLLSHVWPREYARGSINAEFSVLLYFYWDFGVVGVLVGLGAYGFTARYLYEYLRNNPTSPHVQALYALAVWFVIIALRDSPVDTLIRALFLIAPVVLIFSIAARAARRTSGSVSAGTRVAA
jgi:hypothetical protein